MLGECESWAERSTVVEVLFKQQEERGPVGRHPKLEHDELVEDVGAGFEEEKEEKKVEEEETAPEETTPAEEKEGEQEKQRREGEEEEGDVEPEVGEEELVDGVEQEEEEEGPEEEAALQVEGVVVHGVGVPQVLGRPGFRERAHGLGLEYLERVQPAEFDKFPVPSPTAPGSQEGLRGLWGRVVSRSVFRTNDSTSYLSRPRRHESRKVVEGERPVWTGPRGP